METGTTQAQAQTEQVKKDVIANAGGPQNVQPSIPQVPPAAENLIMRGLAEALRKADKEPAEDLTGYLEVISKAHIIVITNHPDAQQGLYLVVLPMSATCYLAFRKLKDEFEILRQDDGVKQMLGIE